jgi:mannobiose 2-epimerase
MSICKDPDPHRISAWRSAVEKELTDNILPFWQRIERPGGGYVAALTDDLTEIPGEPVSLILVTRLLWTYARAFRKTGDRIHRDFAGRALEYMQRHLRDLECGGYFWFLDAEGQPIDRKKQVYGQAFAIFGLSEYAMATGDETCLREARGLFELLEQHAWNPGAGGYWEAFDERWREMDDLRLGELEQNCPLTMNTHLHLLEAYTNLLRTWRAPLVETACRRVLAVLHDRILVPEKNRFGLFYDAQWNLLEETVSPGHDIEGSWLLWEAAEVIGDPGLQAEIRPAVLAMADQTLRHGVAPDGSILDEYLPGENRPLGRNWWPQAEAMVGFLNAFELTADTRYLNASLAVWTYIENQLVDPVHGEWYAGRNPDGSLLDRGKTGPWKACYHNGRACMEVLERLDRLFPQSPSFYP